MIAYEIYTIITLICIRSHICSFILLFSYFSIIHIFLYLIMQAFTHSYIHICLSFVYMYSFLVTSYILFTYIFMYFIILSYLMTYTYTFLYLYVLLMLYQTVLYPIGVQKKDFFFNTLRYPSCPNYLPFYHFLFKSTRINILLLGPKIKNERDSVQYIPEGTVRYRTETCLPT